MYPQDIRNLPQIETLKNKLSEKEVESIVMALAGRKRDEVERILNSRIELENSKSLGRADDQIKLSDDLSQLAATG